jgi:hypothetical protein
MRFKREVAAAILRHAGKLQVPRQKTLYIEGCLPDPGGGSVSAGTVCLDF